MFKQALLGALILASAAHAAPAFCETAAGETAQSRESFAASFFAQYNPSTALDMINRTPGFSIDGEGDGGNVLIDGQRPARGQSLSGLLSRIPAAQVERLEVLRGGEAAAAIPGRAVVLNLIRTASAGDGVWNVGLDLAEAGASPRGALSWSGRAGGLNYDLGINSEATRRSHRVRAEKFAADGALLERRAERSPRRTARDSLTAQANAPLGEGRLSLSGEASARDYKETNETQTYAADGALEEQQRRSFAEHGEFYELGASLEHPLGPWTAQLDGSFALGEVENDERILRETPTASEAVEELRGRQRDIGESLLRGALSQQITDTQRLEIGVEQSVRSVEADRRYARIEGEDETLTAALVSVEQARTAAFAAHLWRPAPLWSVETRLAAESGEIAFSDEIAQSAEFSLWRPSLQVARQFGRNQIRARIGRELGQVNADRMVSVLADNATPDGVPEVRPDTAWRAELRTDLRFGDSGALRLALSQQWIEDVVDYAPAGPPEAPFDALANIGEGEIRALSVNLSTPVEPIPGASFSMSATVADSETTDPITLTARPLSGFAETQLWMEFRQEVAQHDFSWGVSYYRQAQSPTQRRDETGSYQDGPWVDAFIETTAIDGVKARLRASSVLDAPMSYEALRYGPDRAGGLAETERSRRFGGAALAVSLIGSF